MKKTLQVLGMASFLVTGIAAASFAAGGSLGGQNSTETQLGNGGRNQMLPKPATPGAQPTTTYGMNSSSAAQPNVPATPDATTRSGSTPSGGGGSDSGSGAGGGSSSGGGSGH